MKRDNEGSIGGWTPAQSSTSRTTAEPMKEQAKDIMDQAQEQTKEVISSRKDIAVVELESVAQALRRTGEQLHNQEQDTAAGYVDRLASQVERLSSYLDEREVDELLYEVEGLARRNPEVFLGGAFALGLLAARFLKASSWRNQARRSQEMGGRYGEVGYGTMPGTWERRSQYPYPSDSPYQSGRATATAGMSGDGGRRYR